MKKFLKILAIGALSGGLTILPEALPQLGENKKAAEVIAVAALAMRLYLQNPPKEDETKKD